MLRVAAILALTTLAAVASAAPAECDLENFPDQWTEAERQVDVLRGLLQRAERNRPFTTSTLRIFRQSLALCDEKEKERMRGISPGGNGTANTHSVCLATLICARIEAIEIGEPR